MRILNLAISLGIVAISATGAFAQGELYAQSRVRHYANSLAPYVVSPQEIVNRMLELADVKPGETVYDLGSGDGRILITAVVRFKAKAVGVEISDELVKSTNDRIRRLGLDNDARVIHGSFLNVDLSPADVVTLYLATDVNEMLRPNLEKYLKDGARVVSHEYAVPGWKPKLVDKDPGAARPHDLPVRDAAEEEVAARFVATFDVAGVGLNATDTLILLSRFPAYGGKAPFEREVLSPGGQVASAMVACAKLGMRAKYIGTIGDDERGRIQMDSLRGSGINLDDVELRANCPNQTRVHSGRSLHRRADRLLASRRLPAHRSGQHHPRKDRLRAPASHRWPRYAGRRARRRNRARARDPSHRGCGHDLSRLRTRAAACRLPGREFGISRTLDAASPIRFALWR